MNNIVTTICYKVKNPITFNNGYTYHDEFLACYADPDTADAEVKELNEDSEKAKQFCEKHRIKYEVSYFFTHKQERFSD